MFINCIKKNSNSFFPLIFPRNSFEIQLPPISDPTSVHLNAKETLLIPLKNWRKHVKQLKIPTFKKKKYQCNARQLHQKKKKVFEYQWYIYNSQNSIELFTCFQFVQGQDPIRRKIQIEDRFDSRHGMASTSKGMEGGSGWNRLVDFAIVGEGLVSQTRVEPQ